MRNLGPEKFMKSGTSLAVQWSRLGTSTAGGAGSITGWGNKIPHASQARKKFMKSAS